MNRKKIKIGDFVTVPKPKKDDEWICSFSAIVTDIIEKESPLSDIAIVEDQDSDFFQVEINRLKLDLV